MHMSCDIHVTMWSDDQYHSKAFKLWGRNSTKRTNCKRLDSDENGVPWTAFLWSRYLTCTEWTELYGGKKAAGKLVYAHTHFTPSQPPLQRLDFQKEERKERSKSYHSTVAGRDSSNFCILNFQTTSICPLCMHAYYSLSLQPFEHPVCTPEGAVFDLLNIVPYLKKYGHNPVSGKVRFNCNTE